MKTLFIVPGWTHKPTDSDYTQIKKHFSSLGFQVRGVPINWKYRVMSDYVEQFKTYYEQNKSEENYVLGFSFGAMITLISAPDLRPAKIVLCSLSPYFAEDIGPLKPSWKKIIGVRRLEDFVNHEFKKIVSNLSTQAIVFIGEKEGVKFPNLMQRCRAASKSLKCDLVLVPDAPHDIAHPNYIQAIKDHVK